MNYCFKRAIAPLFIFILLMNALTIFGQGPSKLIPPSPNASSLGKYGDIPVGNYTGTPQIGMPIGEAKGKSLSVPISLSYHASGIKVDEVASQVGLGWSPRSFGVFGSSFFILPTAKNARLVLLAHGVS